MPESRSCLVLGFPGSGKTYAAQKGLCIDVDYGYFRRAHGVISHGFISGTSDLYLDLVWRMSMDGVVCVNCPELYESYVRMGFDVTIIMPRDPVSSYERASRRAEGAPCDNLDIYKRWYAEWKERFHGCGIKYDSVATVVSRLHQGSTAMPLAEWCNASHISIMKTHWHMYRGEDGTRRYTCAIPNGVVVVKELSTGGFTHEVHRGLDFVEFVVGRGCKPAGYGQIGDVIE